MFMRYYFIVNPTSGKGKALSYLPLIEEYCKKTGKQYSIHLTEYPKHATQLASAITADMDTMIVSVGGDGTSKEILDGLNKDVVFCIIPAGTGNDFYKSIDSRKLSTEELIAGLLDGEIIKIDMGIINGTSRFINIASYGLDADINIYACDVLKVKYSLPGNMVYAIAALKLLPKRKMKNVDITVDGRKYRRKMLLAALCNGRCYGGCFMPGPEADLQDGIFNLTIVKEDMQFFKLMQRLMKYMKGDYQQYPEFEVFEGKHFELHFDEEINCQVDGENSSIKDLEVTLMPKEVRLMVPSARIIQ